MFLGVIVGWGILSPLAKYKGWAPGPVSNWTNGSKGWIVWVSLAIMLADSIVSLGWLILRLLIKHGPSFYTTLRAAVREHGWHSILTLPNLHSRKRYYALDSQDNSPDMPTPWKFQPDNDSLPEEADAPPEHLISNRTTIITLLLSLLICIAAVQYSFSGLLSISLTFLALVCTLLLSIMGVRALGETDLNPVSGISKVTQLVFALVVPSSTSSHAIPINLLAGAISESGALQAGDLMQDLKTGHLLGAAPAAQFWGQMIGSAVGAVVAAAVYRLYTRVYEIPGGLFQVPTGYVWVFTARLVTGKGLPAMVGEWAAGFGAMFALATGVRVWGNVGGRRWVSAWVPGGIAVAVGKFCVTAVM
jgi:OPT family oligopeptide transporter